MRENLSWGFEKKIKACASAETDQRLINALITRFFLKVSYSEILVFYLLSIAEETDLSLTLSETPKTGFVTGFVKSSTYYI